MKAIAIKYAGPSNTRGSRWIVSDSDNALSIQLRPDLSRSEDHLRALELFRAKYRTSDAKKPIDYHCAEYKDLELYIPIFN